MTIAFFTLYVIVITVAFTVYLDRKFEVGQSVVEDLRGEFK